MKRYMILRGIVGVAGLWLMFGLIVLPVASAQAQSGDAALAEVELAFSRKDVRTLLENASDHLEIAILGNTTLYSKSQALYVLEEFYKRYPPAQVVYGKPSRSDASLFAVGVYHTKGAASPLRVYLRMRRQGSTWELREIRVEQQRRD